MTVRYHTATRFAGRWVAKFEALACFATAGLWVRIRTSLKNANGRHKQRSGQHTLQNKTLYTPTPTSPVEQDNEQFGLFEDDQPLQCYLLYSVYISLQYGKLL
jgi:hypothetical protein